MYDTDMGSHLIFYVKCFTVDGLHHDQRGWIFHRLYWNPCGLTDFTVAVFWNFQTRHMSCQVSYSIWDQVDVQFFYSTILLIKQHTEVLAKRTCSIESVMSEIGFHVNANYAYFSIWDIRIIWRNYGWKLNKQTKFQSISKDISLSKLTLLRFEFIASAESAIELALWSGWPIPIDMISLL